MTTVIEQEKDLPLPWDYFLNKEEGPTATAVQMIAVWRSNEWGEIVRHLLAEYKWVIPDGLEPHWLSPGKAVYWQEQITLERRFVDNISNKEIPHTHTSVDQGHWERTLVSSGWKPTSALPADNASQVAHYLNKGFRLRPPQDGVESEYIRESADLLEVASENPPTGNKFFCWRHFEKGRIGFETWDGYLRHCDKYAEKPIETPPKEILEHAAAFVWYCPIHNIGFMKISLAKRHYHGESKKLGGQYHPTVDDMLVKKVGKPSTV